MELPPNRSGPAPTISRVAAEAMVSRATVSRAFGAPHLLSRETVEAVRAAAARLGYVPNQTARALSTGRTGNIALVVPDITNPFFAALMRGAQARARAAGYAMFLGDSDERPELEDELLAKLAAQVEGFLLVAPRMAEDRIRHHAARRPTVLINSDVPDLTRLLVDTGPSYARGVEHLAELGHRRIAYVAGPAQSWSNAQRSAAVKATAKRLGLRLVILSTPRPSFEAGRACAKPLLLKQVTAALAFDDGMAQGIAAGLADWAQSVPDDFSLIGCDGVIATTTVPALTSVATQCGAAGERAVDILVDMMRDRVAGHHRITIPTDLVVRASTGRPRICAAATGTVERRGGIDGRRGSPSLVGA